MGLAVTEEHQQLADSVRRWAQRHAPISVARAAMGADSDRDDGLWTAMAEQGLLALHVDEAHGGAGFGDPELAVVAEELGRAMVPGPVLPTLHLGRLLTEFAGEALAAKLLPGLAAGEVVGAVALTAGLQASEVGGELRLSGILAPVVGAAAADVVVLGGVTPSGTQRWAVVDRADLRCDPLTPMDATRHLGRIEVSDLPVPKERVLPGLDAQRVREVGLLLYTAEAAGIAGWACDEAAAYAKVREQFGRPIGQFQAVKHACADLLVRAEQARAAAWDLAACGADPEVRAFTAGIAAATALEAAVDTTLETIQILGGIGFTWEHDAHLYLKRATTLRQLFGSAVTWRGDVARRALAGTRRRFEVILDAPEAERVRREIRTVVESLPADDPDRRRALVDHGLVMPHWPRPYGRDAGPVEQLVIDEELDRASVERPNLVIGGWILPTIIHHGTAEQQERFVRPTLLGEIQWCQMFSEPGAGSDLAALQTRAEKVDGGWKLTGQKVWTTLAHATDWSLCLARTDPDAPKHEGITAFLVDMKSDGLDIRPLKEITGNELFNEVFLDGVFVPDDLVCGPVNGGWKAARTTLANERVAMSSGSSMGSGVEHVLTAVQEHPAVDDALLLDQLGRLVCEGHVLGVLGYRTTLKQLSGMEPGASASVRKLVGGRHAKECAELGLALLGPDGAVWDPSARSFTYQFVQTQCLTIAGGTTAVQKNVIAERLLGLPRDP